MTRLLDNFGRSLVVMAFVLLSLAAFASFAQDVVPDAAPGLLDVVQQLFSMFSTFKSGGIIAGAIVLVNLLMNLTKLSWVKEKLAVKPWLMPVLATALPAGLAFLGALATHTPLIGALMAGVTAGLGATGLHELVNVFNPSKQAERAAGATVMAAVQAGDADAKVAVADLHSQLDAMAKMPEAEQSQALAAWAKEHAPGA